MHSQQPNNPEMERFLDEAVTRQFCGEQIDQIINSYPSQYQAELSQLLDVTSLTRQVRLAPLPERSPARRPSTKAALFQAAATHRAELGLPQEAAIVDPPSLESSVASGALLPRRVPPAQREIRRPSFWDQLRDLVASLSGPTARLAPIALAVLMVLAISSSGLYVVSQAAIPGDLTYPIKQWIRQQAVILAPADMRQILLDRQAEEVSSEVEAAAQRQQEEETPKIIDAKIEGIYLGYVSSTKFMVGFTAFEDRYLPSLDALETLPVVIEGELVPGARVRAWYQMVPNLMTDPNGQSSAGINGMEAGSTLLQAKVIKVLAPPPTPTPTPTPAPTAQGGDGATSAVETTPTPTPIPTATGLAHPACAVRVPQGWVGYRVQAGDTLSGIAVRTGASMARLQGVNCLASTQVNLGTILYVPFLPTPPTATPVPPTRTPTNTSVPTHTPTWTPVPTHTPTVEPTTAPTDEPSATPTEAATEVATEAPTAVPSSTATALPTATSTTVSTETPVAELTATPTAPPSETATALSLIHI